MLFIGVRHENVRVVFCFKIFHWLRFLPAPAPCRADRACITASVTSSASLSFGSIYIMNVEGRYLGRSPEELQNVLVQGKSHGLIPKRRAWEVTERLDRDGTVIVDLNEAEARTAIRSLVDDGVAAIAVSLLWSFRNPVHERRIRELVHEVDPDLFVSL